MLSIYGCYASHSNELLITSNQELLYNKHKQEKNEAYICPLGHPQPRR